MSGQPHHKARSESQRYACLSCRQRKLKCDRKQPCANCIARSVDCKQQQFPSPARGIRKPQEDTSTLTSVLSRLDRIEEALFRTQEGDTESHDSNAVGNDVQAPEGSGSCLSATRGSEARDPGGGNDTIRNESGHLVSISANDKTLV